MAEALEQTVLSELRRIFLTELERTEPVELEHELLAQLHVDSLAAIVIAVGLENRFRVKLTEADTDGVVTVADLVQRVTARVRASA